MLCEQCRRRDATIHLTEMQAGRAIETHYCNACGPALPPLPQPLGVELPLLDQEIKVVVLLPAKPEDQTIVRAVHVPTQLTVQVQGTESKEALARLALRVLRQRLNERPE